MTILVDLGLLLALFVSANLALAWGELATYPIGGDKSGLSGLGGVLFFMPMRWVLLGLTLWVGAARGGFDWLPGSGRWQVAQVLLAHGLLGILSYRVFEWVVQGIQQDNPTPQRFAWVFGLVIPIAVFLIAAWSVNRRWIGRHAVIGALLAGAVVAAHVAGWRSGYRR